MTIRVYVSCLILFLLSIAHQGCLSSTDTLTPSTSRVTETERDVERLRDVRENRGTDPTFTDSVILANIIKEDNRDDIRMAAAEKLPDGHRLRPIVLADVGDIDTITD